MSTLVAELRRKAEQQGWRVVHASKHMKWLAPDGKTIVTVGRTESDHRAYLNTLSRMRKAGFHD